MDSKPYSLVETMLVTPVEGVFLKQRHIARLRASAEELGFSTCPTHAELTDALEREAARADGPSRLRLLLDRSGALTFETAPFAADGHPRLDSAALCARAATPVNLVLDTAPVPTRDERLMHKTTRRELYDEARARGGVGTDVVFDVLLYNESGEVTETSIANVALEQRGGAWATPPLRCGLLAGTMRAEMLARGAIYEEVVTLDDLRAAVAEGRGLRAFNALRGVLVCALQFCSTSPRFLQQNR
jgi:branched-subunit amino acid aminotransferase/4-amino-4-deoxychorismate lyase